MLAQIYRRILPVSFRDKIYELFLGRLLLFFRKLPSQIKSCRILLFSPFYPKDEYYNAFRFMGKHGVTAYPTPAFLLYKNFKATILRDEEEGLLYIIHRDKRLYFPRHFTPSNVNDYYKNLLIEQDPDCGHCYTESYDDLEGKTLLDIGAAEGIFALNAIERINYTYLFECDEKWMEALKATFRPWNEKVCILKKYVSDQDHEQFISVDSLFHDKEKNNIYIKMDIEGAELSALKGAEQLLKTGKQITLSVCTYHRPQDVYEIPSYLTSLGYSCSLADGFVFYENNMSRAVCRAKK